MKLRALITLVFFLLFLLALSYFTPYNPFAVDLEKSLLQPSRVHFFGTDANGRDIFSQILYGMRYSLFVGISVVSVCLIIGSFIGFLAGYYSGLVDHIFVFVSDILQSLPGLLLAIAIAAFVPPSLFNLIVILSLVGWVSYARLVRSQVLELKNREFILAAKSLGVPLPRLLWKHFLPNLSQLLVVQASFGIAGVILAESTLSFLGLGLPIHLPSLGKMLDSGVNLLLIAPHVSLFPGLVIMMLILFFNFVGEKLRRERQNVK